MIWLFVGLIVGVVVVDLATKFSFDGILNSGIAWGMGAQLPWLWIVIVLLSLVLAVGMIIWWSRTPRRKSYWFTVGLALFIGGMLMVKIIKATPMTEVNAPTPVAIRSGFTEKAVKPLSHKLISFAKV